MIVDIAKSTTRYDHKAFFGYYYFLFVCFFVTTQNKRVSDFDNLNRTKVPEIVLKFSLKYENNKNYFMHEHTRFMTYVHK